MTALLVVLFLPVLCAGLLPLVKTGRAGMAVFLVGLISHFGAAVSLWFSGGELFDGWLRADPPAVLFLTTVSLLCLGAGGVGLKVLFPGSGAAGPNVPAAAKRSGAEAGRGAAGGISARGGKPGDAADADPPAAGGESPAEPRRENETRRMTPRPRIKQLVPAIAFLFFLSAMSAVCLVQHAGFLWVFVEATTLASAPLIYIHRSQRSLEATWKYLLICSVGIALALFGNILLTIAVTGHDRGAEVSLLFSDLTAAAPAMNVKLLKGAFIFLLVGYGTKMGLVPMHTWLPDAHSEAPGFISALLSGALLNCAFLGILRLFSVVCAAGEPLADFASSLLRGFGLLSLGTAAVFLANQKDYKRMLAYSSVEHMGILAFGVGMGGMALYGAMYHTMNHSLVKAALFLAAGTILGSFGTKESALVRGMGQRIPRTAVLWSAGFFAITGFPPFGTFFSEFLIMKEAFTKGKPIGGALFILFLTVAFFGIAAAVIPMARGRGERPVQPEREPFLAVLVPAMFLLLCAAIGLYLPGPVSDLLTGAASIFGGSR